jgi:hypothetical protein
MGAAKGHGDLFSSAASTSALDTFFMALWTFPEWMIFRQQRKGVVKNARAQKITCHPLHLSGQVPDPATSAEVKVFWFFSSEKNKFCFLAYQQEGCCFPVSPCCTPPTQTLPTRGRGRVMSSALFS